MTGFTNPIQFFFLITILLICTQAEHPIYWSVNEWCAGFIKLIDYLELDKVHLFGASLGKYTWDKL